MTAVPADQTRRFEPRSTVLLIMAGAALIAAFGVGANTRETARLHDAPSLPAVTAACSADPAHAAQRARDGSRSADAHLARYPFAPEEGLRALALLAEARECLRRAGSAEDDPALATRATRYRERIAADYRDHLARLRHALAQGELPQAADDVRYLRALFGEQGGSFALELRALELEVEASASPSTGRQP